MAQFQFVFCYLYNKSFIENFFFCAQIITLSITIIFTFEKWKVDMCPLHAFFDVRCHNLLLLPQNNNHVFRFKHNVTLSWHYRILYIQAYYRDVNLQTWIYILAEKKACSMYGQLPEGSQMSLHVSATQQDDRGVFCIS